MAMIAACAIGLSSADSPRDLAAWTAKELLADMLDELIVDHVEKLEDGDFHRWQVDRLQLLSELFIFSH